MEGFEVLRTLGVGGIGVVYLARQTSMDRLVALKVVSRELAANPEFIRRFYREAEISGNLHDPNIVTVFDSGVEGDAPYLVQEYLGGEDLDRVIADVKAIRQAEADIIRRVGQENLTGFGYIEGVLNSDKVRYVD